MRKSKAALNSHKCQRQKIKCLIFNVGDAKEKNFLGKTQGSDTQKENCN